jgi:hypothetical protein
MYIAPTVAGLRQIWIRGVDIIDVNCCLEVCQFAFGVKLIIK